MEFFGNKFILFIFFFLIFHKENILVVKADDNPEVSQYIHLTNDELYFVFNSAVFDYPYVFEIDLSPELAERNFTIEIYSLNDKISQRISFYGDEDLTVKYDFEDCFTPNTTNNISCKITAPMFFVFFKHDCRDCGFLLFQSSSLPSENCYFSNNVYQFLSEGTPTAISMLSSNSNETCLIFFMIDNVEASFYIDKMFFPNQLEKTLNIYVGTQKSLLVEANSDQVGSWHGIPMNSAFYAIEIPGGSTIMVDFGSMKNIMEISSYPFYSIITSPYFGMIDESVEIDPIKGKTIIAKYKISNYDLKATIKELNIDSQIQYYFLINGQKRNIANLGQNETFLPNSDLQLLYHCFDGNTKEKCEGSFSDLLIHLETFGEKVTYPTTTSTTDEKTFPKISTTAPLRSNSMRVKVSIFEVLALLFITFFCFIL